MALFRSNRGMHLLALPTTHADAENTRRKNIQDGGTTTASRLLAQARVLPQEALVCGSPGRIFPVVEAQGPRRRVAAPPWRPCSGRAAAPSCSSALPWT